MTYTLSAEADYDLLSLYKYGLEWGGDAADRYYLGIQEMFDTIAEDPLRFAAVDHIEPGYRRALYGINSIYFRMLKDGSVRIERILGR